MEPARFGQLVGATPAMRRLLAQLAQVAGRATTVLLEGETGTGKELAAQALHAASPRAARPFVPLQCAALPRGLVESALFGHERGAFTGAVRAQQGAFEEADGGTLYLDEVGELDLDVQPKLLRALESRQVRRVGGAETRPVDVRIVASSRVPLQALVDQGRFRSDLYFRLAVVRFAIPPLRQRLEDVPLLCGELLAALGAADRAHLLTDALLASLQARPWPGNVRELRNALEQILAVGESAASQSTQGPSLRMDLLAPFKEGKARWLDQFERAYVEAALARAGGNISEAARQASLDRMHFLRLMDKHGFRRGRRRP